VKYILPRFYGPQCSPSLAFTLLTSSLVVAEKPRDAACYLGTLRINNDCHNVFVSSLQARASRASEAGTVCSGVCLRVCVSVLFIRAKEEKTADQNCCSLVGICVTVNPKCHSILLIYDHDLWPWEKIVYILKTDFDAVLRGKNLHSFISKYRWALPELDLWPRQLKLMVYALLVRSLMFEWLRVLL